ncbi:MAG: WD40/YVTN/BNR-like repeat-containing protein [Candidatus Kapaibacteriota bacterium]|jgi:photosystem II stability/assembly factor-like uncharacterized protein
MKIIIIIWVTLFVSMNSIQAKHLFEITSNLKCVRYISDTEVITCGENGTILKSIDGGENWKYVNSNTQANLTDIDYLQSNNNFVVVAGGNNILFSSENGEKFLNIEIDTNYSISSVFIYNETTIVVGTHKGKLLLSNNLGLSWNELNLSTKRIGNIFLFENEVYVNDDNNFYYKFDIENQSYSKVNKPANFLLKTTDTYFFDENIGVKTTSNIARTIDGGKNWVIVYNDTISNYRTRFNSFFALDFINDNEGIAVGRYNSIFKTIDSGMTWQLISNFNNLLESVSIDVFENGEEDIVYFTSDRFTVFKSTNSGNTFQPTNLYRDSTFRFARASPFHFFDTNTCIYYSNQDQALFKSNNSGESFVNHIPLDTNDKLNPYKFLNGYNDIFNVSNSLSLNSNSVYFYRSQVLEDKGIQSKSANFTYYSTDKGDTWDYKIISTNYHSLNSHKGINCFYSGGFFIDSAKSIEQGYLSFSAGALKFNNNFDVVQEMKFPKYLLTRSVNFIDEMKGYALLLDKEYKSNLYYTEDGGVNWTNIVSSLDTMYYLSEMVLLDNKLIMTQIYDDFNFKYQTKVLILDLSTLKLETLEINNTPIAIYAPTHITKNYIYFNGVQNKEEILRTRKIFRLKRSGLINSIENYNIENNYIATVWLNSSSSNPFSSQTEFTATWLPNTDLSTVTIKVYDLNGYEVADLTNQLLSNQFSSNQSKIEFSPSNLPTGIYLPVISDGTFKKSISVIYVK